MDKTMEKTVEKKKSIVVQNVTPGLHRKLKIYCANRGISIRQAVIEMVDQATTQATIENISQEVMTGNK
ncbi:hypothetical protein ES705_17161 [subsurface metagenome]